MVLDNGSYEINNLIHKFVNEISKILSLQIPTEILEGKIKSSLNLSVKSGDWFMILDATPRTFLKSKTLKSSNYVLKQKSWTVKHGKTRHCHRLLLFCFSRSNPLLRRLRRLQCLLANKTFWTSHGSRLISTKSPSKVW